MVEFLKKLLNSSLIRFGLVGVMNTLIGTSVMFIAYRWFGLGYWVSSALNYIVGSIFSYFANKYFTFRSKDNSWQSVLRFIVNITVCYLIAYGLAKPLVRTLAARSTFSVSTQEQIAMVTGMVLFVIINYLGQRLLVFKK